MSITKQRVLNLIRVTRFQPIQELVDEQQSLSGVYLVTFSAQMTLEQLAEISQYSDFELTPVRNVDNEQDPA